MLGEIPSNTLDLIDFKQKYTIIYNIFKKKD